jgi:hypothetical protein
MVKYRLCSIIFAFLSLVALQTSNAMDKKGKPKHIDTEQSVDAPVNIPSPTHANSEEQISRPIINTGDFMNHEQFMQFLSTSAREYGDPTLQRDVDNFVSRVAQFKGMPKASEIKKTDEEADQAAYFTALFRFGSSNPAESCKENMFRLNLPQYFFSLEKSIIDCMAERKLLQEAAQSKNDQNSTRHQFAYLQVKKLACAILYLFKDYGISNAQIFIDKILNKCDMPKPNSKINIDAHCIRTPEELLTIMKLIANSFRFMQKCFEYDSMQTLLDELYAVIEQSNDKYILEKCQLHCICIAEKQGLKNSGQVLQVMFNDMGADKNPEKVRQLLEEPDWFGNCAISYVAYNNCNKMFTVICKKYPNFNCNLSNQEGILPLLVAQEGSPIYQYLQKRTNIHWCDQDISALMKAVNVGNINVVVKLLEYDEPGALELNPQALVLADRLADDYNSFAMRAIRTLLSKKIKVNKKDGRGQTLLFKAISADPVVPNLIQALLHFGADPNIACNGQTPMQRAEFLLQKTKNEAYKDITQLLFNAICHKKFFQELEKEKKKNGEEQQDKLKPVIPISNESPKKPADKVEVDDKQKEGQRSLNQQQNKQTSKNKRNEKRKEKQKAEKDLDDKAEQLKIVLGKKRVINRLKSNVQQHKKLIAMGKLTEKFAQKHDQSTMRSSFITWKHYADTPKNKQEQLQLKADEFRTKHLQQKTFNALKKEVTVQRDLLKAKQDKADQFKKLRSVKNAFAAWKNQVALQHEKAKGIQAKVNEADRLNAHRLLKASMVKMKKVMVQRQLERQKKEKSEKARYLISLAHRHLQDHMWPKTQQFKFKFNPYFGDNSKLGFEGYKAFELLLTNKKIRDLHVLRWFKSHVIQLKKYYTWAQEGFRKEAPFPGYQHMSLTGLIPCADCRSIIEGYNRHQVKADPKDAHCYSLINGDSVLFPFDFEEIAKMSEDDLYQMCLDARS